MKSKYKNASKLLIILVVASVCGCKSASTKPYAVIDHNAGERHVLYKGVGLSYDMTPQDAEKIGFKDLSGLSVKHIGLWRLDKVIPLEFWESKQIFFTPISHKVYMFTADRFYKKNELSNETECMGDYRLILAKLKTEYPSLHDVTYRSQSMPKGYHSSTLCEGEEKQKYSPITSGTGRCVSLSCSVQLWSDGRNIGSMLSISYSDSDMMNMFDDEKKIYQQRNQDEMLKKRGISPDQL